MTTEKPNKEMTHTKCKCIRTQADNMFEFIEAARKHGPIPKDSMWRYITVMKDFRKDKLPCHLLVSEKNGVGMSATASMLQKKLKEGEMKQ